MPTIRERVSFNYDGEWSDSYGVVNINIGSGMYEETMLADRNIDEIKIKGNDRPLYKGIENTPLEFDMTIAFVNGYTDDSIVEVVDWLFQNTYKPLYFRGKEDRVFYCMPHSRSSIIHNGLNQGYFTIRMRCNSPYSYSPTTLSKYYDLTENKTSRETIELENDGYGLVYPEISIEKIGDGEITITNTTINGYTLKITNLQDGEKLYIDCEKEIIETDLIGIYRYNDTFGIFPYFQHGRNVIEVFGRCKIQFRYKSKYRF